MPDADLAMIYIEQPDGSGHQFLLTDPRQPTDPANPNSIGAGQDPAKRARYRSYLRTAYQAANEAVQRIIEAVGHRPPRAAEGNVIVVSDHGLAPFHTAVNMNAYLAAKGFDTTKVRAVTSGPAANIYISLQGREPNGTVSRAEYLALQADIVAALRELTDANPNYVSGRHRKKVFDRVLARPTPANTADPPFGLGTNRLIGQDSGDVYAVLASATTSTARRPRWCIRLGDTPPTPPAVPFLSVPNFYGAHGYDPQLAADERDLLCRRPRRVPGRARTGAQHRRRADDPRAARRQTRGYGSGPGDRPLPAAAPPRRRLASAANARQSTLDSSLYMTWCRFSATHSSICASVM